MIHKIKFFLLLVYLSVTTLAISAQTLSYEQQDVVKVAGNTTDAQVSSLSIDKIQSTRVYKDGLGRPVQTLALQASVNGNKDIVQIAVYNSLGQQTKAYLPYPDNSNTVSGSYRSTAINDQTNYYSTNNTSSNLNKVAADNSPWSQQVFENSPLQRVLNAGSVGDGFQPIVGSGAQHYKSLNYRSNTDADGPIKLFGTDGSDQGNYVNNTLSVTDATDEDGLEALSFTDQNGHLILGRKYLNATVNGTLQKYLDTYYIYNNAGMLSVVVPPKASAMMQNGNNWSLTQTGVANLIYRYAYDGLGRVYQKTIPDKGVLYIIYDPLNRPVLIQDANLRAAGKWNYVKYDAKGRAISQGIYTDATNITVFAMQAYVNGLTTYSTIWYEGRSNSAADGYYTNAIFPTSNIEPLAYSYYDDYDLDQDGNADVTYAAQSLSGEAMPTYNVRGKLTATRNRTVGSGLGNIWLTSYLLYDKRNNLIQVRSNNHLNSAINDSKTTVPDFTGKPLVTKVVTSTASVITVQSTYSYDFGSRVTAIDQSYNGAAPIRIATYEYNDIGQLVRKNLNQISTNTAVPPVNVVLDSTNSISGSGQQLAVTASNSIRLTTGFHVTGGATFSAKVVRGNYLQSVDYRYNIRGQLLSINNAGLSNDGLTNNDGYDLFGMEMIYNQVVSGMGNTAYYNGRLSAVKWISKDPSGNAGKQKSYSYAYNNINQLTAGTYQEFNGSAWDNSNAYSESGISYDAGGNIHSLQRNAVSGTTVTSVDNLAYTYDTNYPNRLLTVTDASNNNAIGFKNLTGTTIGSYGYDGSSNLTADPYKGITLAYNILNRTDKVTVTAATGRYINYTYDASGTILRKDQYDNGGIVKTTDYMNGFVYENGTLAYFNMAEGRVRNAGGAFKNEYIIADQQGNARISFEDNGSGNAVVRQENSYYPFGLVQSNSVVATPDSPNRNLYNNGSEWQNDYGDLPDYYQTFYRNYDAALGRFVAADPFAENSESLTTFHYANDNPLMFNDPNGDDANRLWANDNGGAKLVPHNENGGGFAAAANYGSDLFNTWEQNVINEGLLGNSSYSRLPSYQQFNDVVAQSGISVSNSLFFGGNSIYFDPQGNMQIYTNGSATNDYQQQVFTENENGDLIGSYRRLSAGDVLANLSSSANQGGPGPGIRPSDAWFLANGWAKSGAPWYGNFLGPGPDGNPYFLKSPNGKYLQPIDMLDAAAQRHDYRYDLAKTGGVYGALFQDKVFAADKELASAANNIINMSSYGLNDTITGKPFTQMEVAWAYRVTFAFTQLGAIKQFGMWLTGK